MTSSEEVLRGTAELGGDDTNIDRKQTEVDAHAYGTNCAAHREGINHDEMTAYYTQWAEKGTYEEDLCPGRYNGPQIAADTVDKYLADIRLVGRILDVAAGTGTVGKLLYDKGYRKIDALEPSVGMLDKARKKEVYDKHICDCFATDTCAEIADDSYDALVVAGGMGEGHIPVVGLREMARVVKPGGVVVIVMRQQYLTSVAEYRRRLEPFMAALEAAQVWRLLQRSVVPEYSFGKPGVVFAYRVLQAGAPPTGSAEDGDAPQL